MSSSIKSDMTTVEHCNIAWVRTIAYTGTGSQAGAEFSRGNFSVIPPLCLLLQRTGFLSLSSTIYLFVQRRDYLDRSHSSPLIRDTLINNIIVDAFCIPCKAVAITGSRNSCDVNYDAHDQLPSVRSASHETAV